MRRPFCTFTTVLCLWASAALAGQEGSQGSLTFTGAAAGEIDVLVMVNARKVKAGTVHTDGKLLPFDPELLTSKPQWDVYLLECQDGKFVVILAESKDALAPEDKDRCERDQPKEGDRCGCRRLGIWIPGTNATFNLTSLTSRPRLADSSGFSLGLFGFGSGKWTTITNADTAVVVIDDRFNASNYNQPRQIDVDERGSGGGWGGGVNLAWGAVPVGIRVGIAHEQERSSPTQTVLGNRDSGGLVFAQQGDSRIGSTTLFLGPTVHLPAGIVVTGGPAFTWWNLELIQTGSLRAGCPNPCVVVRTDDVREEADGTDVGFHFGAEFYPADRWLGFYLSFMQVTYRDAYDPSRALGWPRDWKDRNVFVGVVIRSNGGRPRRIIH